MYLNPLNKQVHTFLIIFQFKLIQLMFPVHPAYPYLSLYFLPNIPIFILIFF